MTLRRGVSDVEFVHDPTFQCLPSPLLVLKPFETEVSGRDLRREAATL